MKPTQPLRFYHATPRRLLIGEMLIGGVEHGYMQHPRQAVYMNTSPVPHFTIWDKIEHDDPDVWHVYEVEPLGKVYVPDMWDEAVCISARVVRYIGVAKGILHRAKKQHKHEAWDEVMVRPDPHVHGVEVKHTCLNLRAGYNKKRK